MDPRLPASIPVDEVRDYHRINAELAALLDRGHARVRLDRVGGQRLLLAGLRGPWRAAVEVFGDAGPEFAAGLDAPGLSVVVHGAVADGVGRGLAGGAVAVLGAGGDGAGYGQIGGALVLVGVAGHRAGLAMQGGLLVLRNGAGRLCGERQAGGLIVVEAGPLGPDAGHARSGGRLVRPGEPMDDAERARVIAALAACPPPEGPPGGMG